MKRKDITSLQAAIEAAMQKQLGAKKYSNSTTLKSNNKTKYKREWWDNGKGKRYHTRSSWEYNYMCYLEWLMEKKEIMAWDYEPDTFWFEQIRRGVRSYLPDFRILNKDGSYEYQELKGYMDKRSATKIKRMAKYFPGVKLIVVGEKQYQSIKKWARLIPGWK